MTHKQKNKATPPSQIKDKIMAPFGLHAVSSLISKGRGLLFHITLSNIAGTDKSNFNRPLEAIYIRGTFLKRRLIV